VLRFFFSKQKVCEAQNTAMRYDEYFFVGIFIFYFLNKI